MGPVCIASHDGTNCLVSESSQCKAVKTLSGKRLRMLICLCGTNSHQDLPHDSFHRWGLTVLSPYLGYPCMLRCGRVGRRMAEEGVSWAVSCYCEVPGLDICSLDQLAMLRATGRREELYHAPVDGITSTLRKTRNAEPLSLVQHRTNPFPTETPGTPVLLYIETLCARKRNEASANATRGHSSTDRGSSKSREAVSEPRGWQNEPG